MRFRAALVPGVLACVALAACAQVGSEPAPVALGHAVVLCVTKVERPADDSLARDLAQASGLGVRSMTGIGARVVRVEFSCSSDEVCEQGMQRLRSHTDLVEEVQYEGRRRAPRTPVRPQERS